MKRITIVTLVLLSNVACGYNITRIRPLEGTYYYTPPTQVVLVNQYGQPVAPPRAPVAARPRGK